MATIINMAMIVVVATISGIILVILGTAVCVSRSAVYVIVVMRG
jgi:hypothetical protein